MATNIIARCDDFGSSWAANKAILEAVECGYVARNVSCMAPAPYIVEAAGQLAKYKHIAIGMHATLTSEWDGVRWGALVPDSLGKGFTYEDGTFFHSQKEWEKSQPDVDAIIREYDAQLDYLTKLGLPVQYVDSHMFPEYFIPGLKPAFDDWIASKGLLNADDFYDLAETLGPVHATEYGEYTENVKKWFDALEDDRQYFFLTHPTVDSEEMLLCYNEGIPKGEIRTERSFEHRMICSEMLRDFLREREITPIRYTEAKVLERGALGRFLK